MDNVVVFGALQTKTLLPMVGMLFIAWLLGVAVYRICFHPLSKIPGPKIAAVSRAYEFYYDAIKRGLFWKEIEKMHEQYGPIVRINPHEVHIKDPEYYDVLYNFNSKFDKDPQFVRQFGSPYTVQNTVDHDVHKIRRSGFGLFFSKAAVRQLEGLIQRNVEKVCDHLREAKRHGNAISMSQLYRFFTVDVITEYAFCDSYGFLDNLEEGKEWLRLLSAFGYIGMWGRHFPNAVRTFRKYSGYLAKSNRTNSVSVIARALQRIRKQIDNIMAGRWDHKDKDHITIFHEFQNNDKLPVEDKQVERMTQNGSLLVLAGFETTANTLSHAHYLLLKNPDKLAKLKKELMGAWPDDNFPRKWDELEKLPYLTAVIQECLRFSSGVAARLARVNNHSPMYYKDHEIPRGTPISMSQPLIHFNPTIFPNPHSFEPERWLHHHNNDTTTPPPPPTTTTTSSSSPPNGNGVINSNPNPTINSKKFLVPFSRGARECLGMNLAYAELYLCLAATMRRFLYRLHPAVTDRDVLLSREFFVPFPENYDRESGERGVVCYVD